VRFEKPREIAARVLQARRAGGDFVEALLDREPGVSRLSPLDRGLCQELVYGAVRWRDTLNHLISRKTGNRPQKQPVEALLQIGLYQMFWLTRIPPHAAVHETVEAAKALGARHQTGFINALLRSYHREREETLRLLDRLRREDPALGYSQPLWLVERWMRRWPDEFAGLLEWNNAPAPLCVRRNSLKASSSQLQERWTSEGVEFEARQLDWIEPDMVFELMSHPSLDQLRSFREGWFYVQDPSTLLSVQELDPREGETILDLCAAPGGKTTLIAQRMQNRGVVLAEDLAPDRLSMVRENAVRLGVTCVHLATASDDPVARLRRFDRILVDAPCSNTGVIRRRVELRWRVSAAEIRRLRATQLGLLEDAARRLRSGGVLVYSTCSLEPEENEEVVKEFLANHVEFKLERQRALLPFRDSVDGAYVARLRST
jgi:16S rRNA (cytosine967-C5)-methyltransferase